MARCGVRGERYDYGYGCGCGCGVRTKAGVRTTSGMRTKTAALTSSAAAFRASNFRCISVSRWRASVSTCNQRKTAVDRNHGTAATAPLPRHRCHGTAATPPLPRHRCHATAATPPHSSPHSPSRSPPQTTTTPTTTKPQNHQHPHHRDRHVHHRDRHGHRTALSPSCQARTISTRPFCFSSARYRSDSSLATSAFVEVADARTPISPSCVA